MFEGCWKIFEEGSGAFGWDAGMFEEGWAMFTVGFRMYEASWFWSKGGNSLVVKIFSSLLL